jgi:peptide methionine sulfoxide reductase MsrB
METRYYCTGCNTKLFNPEHLVSEEQGVLVFSKPVTPDSVHLTLEVDRISSLDVKTKILCDNCSAFVGYLDMKNGMSFHVKKETVNLV